MTRSLSGGEGRRAKRPSERAFAWSPRVRSWAGPGSRRIGRTVGRSLQPVAVPLPTGPPSRVSGTHPGTDPGWKIVNRWLFGRVSRDVYNRYATELSGGRLCDRTA